MIGMFTSRARLPYVLALSGLACRYRRRHGDVMSDGDWFAPKRLGYGAGLPIAWQGWALVGAYAATVTIAAILLTPRHPALFAGLAIILTVPLIIVSAQHTRGGWRWRWNGRD